MDNNDLQEQQQVDQGQPSSRTLTQRAGEIKQGVSDATAKAAKATRGLSKVEKGAAKAAKATAKGMKVAGKAVEAGGKAMQKAGQGIESAGNAAGSALSAIPYVGGVLGAIVKGAGTAAGKTTEGAGKVTEAGGKGMQKAGNAMEKASKNLENSSKRHKAAAKKMENFSKKVDKGNFSGDKEKGAAKNAAGAAAQGAKKAIVDKIKGLINPADPERILKKTIKKILIFVGVFLFVIILLYISISGSTGTSDSTNDTATDETILCDGNIKLAILGELTPPVSLTEGQLITFDSDTNYGYSGVFLHNGVDLTEKSTNTKPGDNVYSVYKEGVVLESTYDNTFSDKKVNGGWVKINYKMKVEKNEIDFIILYGGLSKESLTLKKGDKVDNKQVIGKVGTAAESEEGKEAGIHFGFYDNLSKRYLNPVNLFIPCYREDDDSALKVHEISISKSDFNKATRDHLNKLSSSSSCAAMKDWDLDKVYEISASNGLNPEFVIIRALKEGCSPYSKGLTSYNNYWGIGCYNGVSLSKCTSYSSFENGVKGLSNLKIVKESNTLFELMSKYAYLGDFWFNPGNSGDGGCYFFSSIKKYMTADRVSTVETYCAAGKSCKKGGKGECLATTDEDKKAYTKYLCEDMDKTFKDVYSKYHTY